MSHFMHSKWTPPGESFPNNNTYLFDLVNGGKICPTCRCITIHTKRLRGQMRRKYKNCACKPYQTGTALPGIQDSFKESNLKPRTGISIK